MTNITSWWRKDLLSATNDIVVNTCRYTVQIKVTERAIYISRHIIPLIIIFLSKTASCMIKISDNIQKQRIKRTRCSPKLRKIFSKQKTVMLPLSYTYSECTLLFIQSVTNSYIKDFMPHKSKLLVNYEIA